MLKTEDQELSKEDVGYFAKLREEITDLRLDSTNSQFRNKKIGQLSIGLGTSQIEELSKYLLDNGALEINFETRDTGFNGHTKSLTFARAAETSAYPMGTALWIRDNAFIAWRLMQLNEPESLGGNQLRDQGEKVLFSLLDVMSSKSQLDRFQRVINLAKKGSHIDASDWPHIFLDINNNLTAEKNESWGHKQDAFQILSLCTLDLIDKSLISLDQLSEQHRCFLSSLAPFMQAVKYWECENSGSWEEIEAVRSSVIGCDYALIEMLNKFYSDKNWKFLDQVYYSNAGEGSPNYSEFLQSLAVSGAEAILQLYPRECQGYSEDSGKNRDVDAAQLYLLIFDVFPKMAERGIIDKSQIIDLEQKLLEQILSIYDPQTGGMYRYNNDSYQRQGFFRPSSVSKLREMYGSSSGNASNSFVARDELIPKGKEAAWSHPVLQLANFAAIRYQQVGDEKYFQLQKRMLESGLRMITAESGEFALSDDDNAFALKKVKGCRLPECILTEEVDGALVNLPSPHTPLNWAVGELIAALDLMKKSLKFSELK